MGHSHLCDLMALTVSLIHEFTHQTRASTLSQGLSWLRVTKEGQVLITGCFGGQTAWRELCFSWTLNQPQHQILPL